MNSTGSYIGDLFVVVTMLGLLLLMLAGLEAAANVYDWLRNRLTGKRGRR